MALLEIIDYEERHRSQALRENPSPLVLRFHCTSRLPPFSYLVSNMELDINLIAPGFTRPLGAMANTPRLSSHTMAHPACSCVAVFSRWRVCMIVKNALDHAT